MHNQYDSLARPQSAQAAAIQEFGHEEMNALHVPQDISDLPLRHDDRRTGVPFGTGRLEFFVNRDIKHSFIKENNGIEGLTLGGGGDISLNCQMGQEGFNLPFTHIPGMGLPPVVPDIAHDPIAIGLFGAIGVVVIPQDLSNLIHEPEFRIRSEFF